MFSFCYCFLCRWGNNQFDVLFWRIRPVIFLPDWTRTFFRRKMESTRSMKVKMEWEVFISRWSRRFSFIDNMIKVLFSICTLSWRLNNYVSLQGKGINKRNESNIIIIHKFVAFCIVLFFWNHQLFASVETLFPGKRRDRHLHYKLESQFSLNNRQSFPLRLLAT